MSATRTQTRRMITPRLNEELANELYEYARRTRRTLNATVELLLERGLRSSRELAD